MATEGQLSLEKYKMHEERDDESQIAEALAKIGIEICVGFTVFWLFVKCVAFVLAGDL